MASVSGAEEKPEKSGKQIINIKNADLIRLLSSALGNKAVGKGEDGEKDSAETKVSQQQLQKLLQPFINPQQTSQRPSSSTSLKSNLPASSLQVNVTSAVHVNVQSSADNTGFLQLANAALLHPSTTDAANTATTTTTAALNDSSCKNLLPLSLFSSAMLLPTNLFGAGAGVGNNNNNLTQPLLLFNPAQLQQQQQQPVLIPIGHMLSQNLVLNQECLNKLLQLQQLQQQQPLQQSLPQQSQQHKKPKPKITLSSHLKQQACIPRKEMEALLQQHQASASKRPSSLTHLTTHKLINKLKGMAKVKSEQGGAGKGNRLSQLQPDENISLDELEQYARTFKRRRIELGFTQGDVGTTMGHLYGNDFSQTTISRFEALNLSFKNMCKLKPLLQVWLMDADQRQNRIEEEGKEEGSASSRKRKRRTIIDTAVRMSLEQMFCVNSKPSSEELGQFADKMNMEKEVIRVWFCNRRQKEKRINPPSNFAFHNTLSPQKLLSDPVSSTIATISDSVVSSATHAHLKESSDGKGDDDVIKSEDTGGDKDKPKISGCVKLNKNVTKVGEKSVTNYRMTSSARGGRADILTPKQLVNSILETINSSE